MADSEIPADMVDVLGKFDADADQIVRKFVSGIEAQKPPPAIYHYTNDLGLRGILETGQLWLTDIFDLNDPSEISHSFSHAIAFLQEKAAKAGPEKPETRLFAKHFAEFRDHGGLQAAAHFFVCSFSARNDDLGQWRAYADNGRGYALRFTAGVLEEAFAKPNGVTDPNNCTFPVSYEDSRLAHVHAQIVDRVFDLISLPRGKKLDGAIVSEYMKRLHIALTLHTLRAALFFKHSAYDNEQEYRFLQIFPANQPAPGAKRRSRPYQLVRYREFDWRKVAAGALTQIVVGPAADPLKASKYARDCLEAFHAGDVEIVDSKVPYRSI